MVITTPLTIMPSPTYLMPL